MRLNVALFLSPGVQVTRALVAGTSTIPIIATTPDLLSSGFVASLARPGGNVTGINFFAGELVAKRLEILRELVPGAARVAVLVNPASVANAETTVRDAEAAARAMRLQVQVLNAGTRQEIDAAFATFASERPDALFVSSDTLPSKSAP